MEINRNKMEVLLVKERQMAWRKQLTYVRKQASKRDCPHTVIAMNYSSGSGMEKCT